MRAARKPVNPPTVSRSEPGVGPKPPVTAAWVEAIYP